MGEDQRREIGDLDRVAHRFGLGIGQAEQDQRGAALRMGLEMPLHRSDLGGLMFEGVQPVEVAGENLQRCDHDQHARRHGEHQPRALVRAIARQVPAADRAHDERRGQIRRQNHVHEAVGEGRIEDDRPPVHRHELPDVVDRVALGRLHPAVD